MSRMKNQPPVRPTAPLPPVTEFEFVLGTDLGQQVVAGSIGAVRLLHRVLGGLIRDFEQGKELPDFIPVAHRGKDETCVGPFKVKAVTGL